MFIYDTGKSSVTQKVSVARLTFATEPKPEPGRAPDPNVKLASDGPAKPVPAGGGMYSVRTQGTSGWTASVSDDWIELNATSGEAGKTAGIKAASGDIVALVDSDNILPDPSWLERMLAPFAKEFVTVTPDNPRSLPAEDLARHLECYELPVCACKSVSEGVQTAIEHAGPDGVVCACGSLYMISAICEALNQIA